MLAHAQPYHCVGMALAQGTAARWARTLEMLRRPRQQPQENPLEVNRVKLSTT